MTGNLSQNLEPALPAFAPAFTKPEMLDELYDALWSWARGLSLNLGQELVLNMFSNAMPALQLADLTDLESPARETPGFIKVASQWEMVRAIDQLYDFGMLGIRSSEMETIDTESSYTRASAFVLDLMDSKMQQEIGTFGDAFYPHKALVVAQTAAARCTLEGIECFYAFAGQAGGGDNLTIKDLALVAKMEEKTIRNAANKNRPGFLKTISIDGSTFITPDDAKEWLRAKGRYLPITRSFTKAGVDLATQGFADTLEVWSFIEERLGSLHMTLAEFNQAIGADVELDAEGQPDPRSLRCHRITFNVAMARDEALVGRIAQALNLDAQLLRVRMLEAAAREELEFLGQRLRQLNKRP